MQSGLSRNTLSRRALLQSMGIGLAAAAVGTSLGGIRAARAQATPSFAREAAFYKARIGTMEYTIINDGFVGLPSSVLAVNAPEGALAEMLTSHYLPPDVFTAPANVMLLETGDHRILIDAGLGDVSLPGAEPNGGKLIGTLALLGIDPSSIDTVIITHIHPDHIGGVADPNGRAIFPNATHYLPQADLDFWLALPTDTPDDFANLFASVAQTKIPAIESQIEPYNGETEILPGIRVLPAPGHTPGHSTVFISSDDERLLNIADVTIHHVVGFEEPGWYLGLEIDSVTAERTRRDVFAQAAEDRFKVFGYHFPFPGIGYVLPDQANERWDYLVTG